MTWDQAKNLEQNLYNMSPKNIDNTLARKDNQSGALEKYKAKSSIHHHQKTQVEMHGAGTF